MATRQQERVGVADFCFDNTEIACSIEQAGIPALPVRQSSLDFVAKSHERNVTERPSQDNGTALILDHVQREQCHDQNQRARYDELQGRQAFR